MQNYENFNLTPDGDDNDRTRAFSLEKRERRPDSVLWIISGLIIFFLNVLAIARITIIGQFLDDVIFTLPFGWFKYFLYLLFFLIDFAIYFGIKFKPKKRFLAMVFLTWVIMCWLMTSLMMIIIHYSGTSETRTVDIFSKTIFKDTLSYFWTDWKNHSVFNNTTTSWIISPKENYLTPYAGGGMIGALFAGLSAYTSIFGGFIIAVLSFFVDLIWIFTGDPFYLFKPKHKRKPKRLRILSLKAKEDNKNMFYASATEEKNKKKKKKEKSRFGSFFQTMTLPTNKDFDKGVVIESMRESDITIELPSFAKSKTIDSFYEAKPAEFYKGEYKNASKTQKLEQNDFANSLQNERQYEIGNRGYINVAQNQLQPNFDEVEQFKVPPVPDFSTNNYQPQQQNNYQPQVQANQEVPPQAGQPNDLIYPKRYKDQKQPEQTNQVVVGKYQQEFIGDMVIGKDVSKEEAQKRFDMERQITPYGANGKTMEVVRTYKEQDHSPKQITLEDVIAETVNENLQREQKIQQYEQYSNPIEDTYSKTLIMQGSNYQPSYPNQQVRINPIKSFEKENFVNKNFILPSNSILNEIKIDQNVLEQANEAANKKASAINQVFTQFGVSAKVTKVNVGPSVTKFEVQPQAGTKVNAITGLENEIKYTLASKNVLVEAPIQGKSAIGIEIPNDDPAIVPLRSVLEKIPYNKMNAKLFFGIGKNVYGEVLFGELDKAPHLLVAGSTGSGKSVMINSIICSILMRAKPHEVKFLMIDPKKVELSIYAPIPHLLAPVISDMSLANNALKKVVNEMERRYGLFERNGVKNMEGYNAKIKEANKQLPYYVIVIDELADLMMTSNKKDVEDSIMRLTQMARAAGIHLIVATQRPSTDVITGVIKTNIPTRISFAVASAIDSRTILDSGGAEKLNGRGDLLYLTPGSNTLTRAQGAFISDEEIANLVNFVSRQQEQIFDEDFMRQEPEGSEFDSGAGKDSLFDSVREYVINEQRASTSLIQRVFSIGYNRAAKIIDDLEAAGVIGPQNGAKPREVFIKNSNI